MICRAIKFICLAIILANPVIYTINNQETQKISKQENIFMGIFGLILVFSSFFNFLLTKSRIKRRIDGRPYCTYITVQLIKTVISLIFFTPILTYVVELYSANGLWVYGVEFTMGMFILLASILATNVRENALESKKQESIIFKGIALQNQSSQDEKAF